MGSVEEERLLQNANSLLKSVGLQDKPLTEAAELQQSASSMFVAIFESVFGVRLGHVKRRPRKKEDYVFNAQLVLNGLRKMLPQKVEIPSEISGEAIYKGEWPALAFMIALFAEVNRVMPPKNKSKNASKGKRPASSRRQDIRRSTSRSRRGRKVRSTSASRQRLRGGRPDTPSADSSSSRDPFLSRSPTGSLLDVSRPSENSMDLSSTEYSGKDFEHTTSDSEYPGLELGEGKRHKGVPYSGQGLGPDGRPGTAKGGARGRLSAEVPATSNSAMRPPAAPEEGGFPKAPAVFSDQEAQWTDEDDEYQSQTAWLGEKSVESSSTDNEQSDGQYVDDRVQREGNSFARVEEESENEQSPTHGVQDLIWDQDYGAGQSSKASPPSRRVMITGEEFGDSSETQQLSAEDEGGYEPRQLTSGAVTATTDFSSLQYDGGELGEQSSKRSLNDVKKAAQQLDTYTKLQQIASRKEMQRIKTAQQAAIKERTAAWRAQEHKMLQKAKARSRAARHTRKVSSIRTKRYLEDVQRKNLSLRLQRSNKQDAFMTALLRAVNEQQRMIAIEKSKAIQADHERAMEKERRTASAQANQLRIEQDIFNEASEQQAKDHEAAMKAQQEQLRESAREMAQQQKQLAEDAKNQLEQNEQVWLKDNVERFDMKGDRFFGDKDPEEKLKQALGIEDGLSLQQALNEMNAAQGQPAKKQAKPRNRKASKRRIAWRSGNVRGATLRNSSSGGGGGGSASRAVTAFGSPPAPKKYGGYGLLEETKRHWNTTLRQAKKKSSASARRRKKSTGDW